MFARCEEVPLQVARGRFRTDGDGDGRIAQQDDRREVLLLPAQTVAVERGIHGEGRRRQHHGVAIRLGARGGLEGDVAAGARAVLHRYGLAQRGGQFLRGEPRNDVTGAARGEADDEADRTFGIGGASGADRRDNQGTAKQREDFPLHVNASFFLDSILGRLHVLATRHIDATLGKTGETRMATRNRRVLYARRPREKLTEDCFALDEVPAPSPGAGQILISNPFLSIDPYQRRQMMGVQGYPTELREGGVMIGRSARPSASA
jgi:hypothetical protein